MDVSKLRFTESLRKRPFSFIAVLQHYNTVLCPVSDTRGMQGDGRSERYF